jgi:hypothetical protein
VIGPQCSDGQSHFNPSVGCPRHSFRRRQLSPFSSLPIWPALRPIGGGPFSSSRDRAPIFGQTGRLPMQLRSKERCSIAVDGHVLMMLKLLSHLPRPSGVYWARWLKADPATPDGDHLVPSQEWIGRSLRQRIRGRSCRWPACARTGRRGESVTCKVRVGGKGRASRLRRQTRHFTVGEPLPIARICT